MQGLGSATIDHSQVADNKYLDYNFQREIIKKKHMLDLMMQKKLSRRKKKIIKVYGKDMLAEMYLDLLNITEGEMTLKRILSPLSGRVPRSIKKSKQKKKVWDNTMTISPNQTLKFTSSSIFNGPTEQKSSRSASRKHNTGSRNRRVDKTRVTSADNLHEEGRTVVSNPQSNSQGKRTASTHVKTRVIQEPSRTIKNKGNHSRVLNLRSPGPQIHRK